MTAHDLYVTAAYGVSAVLVLAMIVWIVVDYRQRRSELAELEASGVRRRSDRRGQHDGH